MSSGGIMTIFEVLKKDHAVVKELLENLINLQEDDEQRGSLIAKIRDELIPHARAEESVFYNSLRSMDAAKDIIMDGYQEHMEAEALLRLLQVKDKIDADWKMTANKLKEAVEHHIAEEEEVVFNVAKELLSDREAEMMGSAFTELKAEVKNEGFLKTTFDLLVNLMPPRFTPEKKDFSSGARL